MGVAATLAIAFFSTTYLSPAHEQSSKSSATTQKLPEGCSKPENGYLIIASNEGFNDSIPRGAPEKPWPIVAVHKGEMVKIIVCNIDIQAHGFQITHYFESNIETLRPGAVIQVSFFATEAGTFEIYCSIFCTIHVFMQNGQLRVMA